jgi:hypothetical protein
LEEDTSIISCCSAYDEFDLAHVEEEDDKREATIEEYEDIVGDPDYMKY